MTHPIPVSTPEPASAAKRLAFIDNLRWVMIVLVVSMHAAVTYSHLGSWYFREDPKPGLATTLVFATYQTWLQAFFMGFLFLIAGYFVPAAYDRKGFGKFLRDRAVRLGIPTLIYMLAIHPLVVYWMLHDYYGIKTTFAQGYGHYLTSFRFIGNSGPMWFTFALLIFCLIYGLLRVSVRSKPVNTPQAALPAHTQVVLLGLVMGLCTFLVRTVQPLGTNVLNMQLCYFSDYVLLFIAGIYAWRRNWMARIPYSFGMLWFKLALIAGGLAWAAYMTAVVRTNALNRVGGGFTWESAALCFWEAFFCLGICLGLTVLFRQKFNRQDAFAKWLSDNCFSVYLFHTPALIAVTLAMRPFIAPKPMKFLVATVLGVTATYLASSLVLRHIPLLKRVL
jgi:glucan biosynthesis protein C